MEWAKKQYQTQYDTWVPWLEDMYLRYFTRDNKASYATRDNLDKTKITGIKQVDNLQDGVNNLVTDQMGQDGLGRPIGDLASTQGINRVERQGKDDRGGYVPEQAGPLAQGGNSVVGGIAEGGKRTASDVQGGLQNAGGMLGLSGNK